MSTLALPCCHCLYTCIMYDYFSDFVESYSKFLFAKNLYFITLVFTPSHFPLLNDSVVKNFIVFVFYWFLVVIIRLKDILQNWCNPFFLKLYVSFFVLRISNKLRLVFRILSNLKLVQLTTPTSEVGVGH